MVARFHLQTEYRKRYVSSALQAMGAHDRNRQRTQGRLDSIYRWTDRDPRRAAELATGWVEEYRRLTASLAVTEASQRRLVLRAGAERSARRAGPRRRQHERYPAAHRGTRSRRPGASHDCLRGHAARPGGRQGGRDSRHARIRDGRESRSGARAAGVDRHGKPVGRDGREQRPRHGRSDCAQGKDNPGRS